MDDDQDQNLSDKQKAFSVFLANVKLALEGMVGPEGMVAVWGDPSNEVFCISVSLNRLPALLVMSSCTDMLTSHLHDVMAKSYIRELSSEGHTIISSQPKDVM